MARKNRGFTLIELMIVIAIIAIIAAIAIPGLLQSQRASNERNASASLKTIATAEADFRSNDRDGNRVNDFWTLTCSGLGTIVPVGATTVTTNAIKLIEPSIIAAENSNVGATRTHAVGGGGGFVFNEMGPSNFGRLGAKAGYWYMALIVNNGITPAAVFNQQTDGAGGASVHNVISYGMMCYPDNFNGGRQMFVVNESNTVYKRQLIANMRNGTLVPPNTIPLAAGVLNGAAVAPQDWPSDGNLSSFYARLD
jgi:prepilin-type N-terminal cleavage/methylation domain-containing protein